MQVTDKMPDIPPQEDPEITSRKADHIRINLEEDVRSSLTTGLEKYRFVHEALPEMNLSDVDLSQTIFGKTVRAPLLISSMTGGTEEAGRINPQGPLSPEAYPRRGARP